VPSTAVVADTTSYLPPELIEEHNIHLVSLYVGIEGDQDRESDVGDLRGFYERLRASDQTVTTSQPSVGDFIAVYEPLLAGGHEIVSIHLSSGISGTYESAMQARERLTAEGRGGERIVVCDSRTGCGGMGLMILAAANAAELGANATEANERARALREELKIWFAVDTLDYLRRGGRIGAASALLGTALSVKPILHVHDGRIVPLEKVRTVSKGIARLEALALEATGNGPADVAVQHLAAAERAGLLAERLRSRLPQIGRFYASEIGAVVGAHVGPGVLGVVVVRH
jgi:DegV family protein with EDD domain